MCFLSSRWDGVFMRARVISMGSHLFPQDSWITPGKEFSVAWLIPLDWAQLSFPCHFRAEFLTSAGYQNHWSAYLRCTCPDPTTQRSKHSRSWGRIQNTYELAPQVILMPGVTITHFVNAASVYHVYVSLFCWAVVSCISAVLESSGKLNRDLAPPQISWIRTSRDGSWESIFWTAPSISLIQSIFPLAFGSPSCILQTPQGGYKLKSKCFLCLFRPTSVCIPH